MATVEGVKASGGTIYWREDVDGRKLRKTAWALVPLPADAPQEVRDLAARVWTSELIAAEKEKWKKLSSRPPITKRPAAADDPQVVVERMSAVEARTDANMLSMGRMVMETKNEMTLAVSGLQAQINGLASQVAALMVKVG